MSERERRPTHMVEAGYMDVNLSAADSNTVIKVSLGDTYGWVRVNGASITVKEGSARALASALVWTADQLASQEAKKAEAKEQEDE